MRLLLFSVLIWVCAVPLAADTIEGSMDVADSDIQALREWINTKRQQTLKEVAGDLSISGEVRTEFIDTAETVNGIKQRGAGGATDLPSRAYDIEVNLLIDYRTERSWAAIKLEFDNDAGVFHGTLNKLKLEKAYFGVRLIEQDTYTTDIELGRRRLSTVFDSKLEFGSFFDGILLKYDRSWEKAGDFYAHVGAFVINERHDQYGYVGELGLLNIANTGLYVKYSLIDWDTKHYHDPEVSRRFHFIVSQLILGYRFIPRWLNKTTIIYLSGLYNHRARPLAITAHKKANFGGYAGFSIGQLRKQHDWALDANYQVLAAQAVPDFDVAGIGLGNASNTGFYGSTIFSGPAVPNTRKTAGGNVNYRGFQVTLEYLLTDKLNLFQQYQQSITLDDSIGPFRRFKQYEIEFIYAF
jgi:hypothetical protein